MDLKDSARELARTWFEDTNETAVYDSTDLEEAITAAEAWLAKNRDGFVSSLPETIRGTATADQVDTLLGHVAQTRKLRV